MEFFVSSFTGGIHSFAAVVALVSGVFVFLNPKGTSQHKKIGYVYVVAMLVLNISAIPLQGLFGGIGWFHLFILMSLPNILIGLYFPLFRRDHPHWQEWHFESMAYSYVGLIAAFIAEVIIRVPLAAKVSSLDQFVAGVFVVAGIVGVVGWRIISGYKNKFFSKQLG